MVLIVHWILAGAAVVAVAGRPAASASGAVAVVLAAVDVAVGAPLIAPLEHVVPLLVFVTSALTLAVLAESSGVVERAADLLAEAGRGHSAVLYALVCCTCAAATAVVSLDGAVVVMLPLLLALARRHGAPFAALFLGSVAVANAASLAVPQGNPTNLVLIGQLGLSPGAFVERMFLPGLAAAVVCALGAALFERRSLAQRYAIGPSGARRPLTAAERRALLAVGAAGAAAFVSPLLHVPVWWPFSAVAALALVVHPRPRPSVRLPVRLAAQLAGLLVVIGALGLASPAAPHAGTADLLVLAAGIGAAAALANNLPVSVSAAGLFAPGLSAYAAAIGLAVGSLATRQGSVATLIAADLAGPCAPPIRARQLLPLAAAGLVAATLVLVSQT